MLVLDAYALEAFLIDERPSSDIVEAMFLEHEQVVMSAINLAEVVDRLQRIRGVERAAIEADVTAVGMTVSPVDTEVAFDAAGLRAAHYQRRSRAVSLADCCAAALALDRDAVLVTSDPALLSLMYDENGRFLALPDSSGTTWAPPRGGVDG